MDTSLWQIKYMMKYIMGIILEIAVVIAAPTTSCPLGNHSEIAATAAALLVNPTYHVSAKL